MVTTAETEYAIAPKLISEMTSITAVTFQNLRLTQALKDQHNSLVGCFKELTSDRNGWKVQQVVLENVSVETIFDAETFCKKFYNKLTKV